MSENLPPALESLSQEIKTILSDARLRAEKAVEEIAIRSYWDTGRVIHDNNITIEHGSILRTLADNAGIDFSLLARTLQFYLAWPTTCPTASYPSLTWSHYKILLPIKDAAVRTAYASATNSDGWSVRMLSQSIKDNKLLPSNTSSDKPTTLKRRDNRLHIYKTVLERVVDGDTLLVSIDLGFDVWVKKRIRLRGIDTPPKNTPDGQKAFEFVKQHLLEGDTIVVQTFQVDLHGRFVADVFFLPNEDDKEKILKDGIYLNELLLTEELAILFEIPDIATQFQDDMLLLVPCHFRYPFLNKN